MANDRLYVIINDVSSLDIEGLFIEELPTISKPSMRSLREEIDGRDGDIVTKLGYSAYDKEMKIGLAQNYDINEVISFFNSKGKIQFSNELDKYYNFEILEQIDFESLQTFKSAVVTFHCQPFKYPMNETPIEGGHQSLIITSNCNIKNTEDSSIGLKLYGNTYQENGASLNTPKDIYSAYYNQIIKSTGKNIFNDTELYVENRRLNIEGESIIDSNYDIYRLPLNKNDEYVLSMLNQEDSEKEIVICYHNEVFPFTNIRSFTLSPNASFEESIGYNSVTFIDISIPKSATNIQIENNNVATEYSPYEGQTFNIHISSTASNDIYLNKIGIWKDTIFKNNADSEFYNTNLELNAWYIHKVINKVDVPSGLNEYTISDIIYASGNENTYFSKFGGTRNGNKIQYSGALPYDDTILYVSNNPIDIKLYFQEEFNYLFDTLRSCNNETNFFVYSYQLSPTFEAEISMQNYITISLTNEGNIYSKPILDIEGFGVINVYLNNNQLFSVNVETEIIIDSANLEAYNPNTHQLMNRQVVGNIENLKLEPGENILSFNGSVTKASITNYTRYL